MALRSLGFEPRKDEVKKLMSDNDKDNSGKINKAQFLEIFRAKWVSRSVAPQPPLPPLPNCPPSKDVSLCASIVIACAQFVTRGQTGRDGFT